MIYSIGKKMEKISFSLPCVLKNVHREDKIGFRYEMQLSIWIAQDWVEEFWLWEKCIRYMPGRRNELSFVYAVISHDHAPNNIKRNYLREDVSNDTNTTTSATIDPIFKSIAILRLWWSRAEQSSSQGVSTSSFPTKAYLLQLWQLWCHRETS